MQLLAGTTQSAEQATRQRVSDAQRSSDVIDTPRGLALMQQGTAIDPKRLRSIGSFYHFAQNGQGQKQCRPCTFFPKGRCIEDRECMFCHYNHVKPKQQSKGSRARKKNKAAGEGTEEYDLSMMGAYESESAQNQQWAAPWPADSSTGIDLMQGSQWEGLGSGDQNRGVGISVSYEAMSSGDQNHGVGSSAPYTGAYSSTNMNQNYGIGFKNTQPYMSSSTSSGLSSHGPQSSSTVQRPPCQSPTCTSGILPRCPLCGRWRE